MGKKTRKTRWRTLSITGENSDSEESNSNSVPRLPKPYQQKSTYYEKFGNNYSSQSTPRRRFQYDSSSKSTRSSSTTSENKITFNEDEYTRITTPRQDVLFKKGYLNKPKNYQTQTSTGTSTNSTGNSTGNGTPDHQSTDLEYESQFVFPNGFLDQNGIYYVNSYEPYPLMVYNPPSYYQEYNGKSKRYSTGSLTESMSPNNEEATSQDLSQSGGEVSNNVSDCSGHHVYNMMYPGYYVNGVGPQNELANGHYQNEPTKRVKKRRRRKTSKSQPVEGDTSEYTDEDDSSDEIFPKPHDIHQNTASISSNLPSSSSSCTSHDDTTKINERTSYKEDVEFETLHKTDIKTAECDHNLTPPSPPCALEEASSNTTVDGVHEKTQEENASTTITISDDLKTDDKQLPKQTPSLPSEDPTYSSNPTSTNKPCSDSEIVLTNTQQKYYLKPDAEEFVPRAYRAVENSLHHPLPIKFLPPNFVPIPLVPMGEFNGQNFNHAFIPPGIPINFIPHQDPAKMFSGYVSYVPPNQPYCPSENIQENHKERDSTETEVRQNDQITFKTEEVLTHTFKDDAPKSQKQQNVCNNRTTIDIATVVSKLEVAAKEQTESITSHQDELTEVTTSPIRNVMQQSKPFKNVQRFRNSFKRNQYNKYRNPPRLDTEGSNHNVPGNQLEKSELTTAKPINGIPATTEISTFRERNNYYRASPERLKHNWKQSTYQNNSPKLQTGSFLRQNNVNTYQASDIPKQSATVIKSFSADGKNYSEMLKKPQSIPSQHNSEKQRNSPTSRNDISKERAQHAPQSPSKPNQWISVSNRKKRKNKSAQESENGVDELSEATETDQSELYESYDVHLLVDVVPPSVSKQDEKVSLKHDKTLTSKQNLSVSSKQDEIVLSISDEIVAISPPVVIKDNTASTISIGGSEIEDILTCIAQNETTTALTNGKTDVGFIPEVSHIEKELLVKVEEVTSEIATVVIESVPTEDMLLQDILQEMKSDVVVDNKVKNRKKSKKGCQKPITKKVIITDIDLSMEVTEIKTPIKKIVKKVDCNAGAKITNNTTDRENKAEDKILVKSVSPVRNEEVAPEVAEVQIASEIIEKKTSETLEKKSKKKKKKNVKPVLNNSLSSSNATLSAVDDSYDFLLESSLLNESVEKTNDEISQELDKIIQKGMYGNLEEKIKSLNVDESDSFFKNVLSNISTKDSSLAKSNYTTKPHDFNKIFQSTRHFLRPNSVSVEETSKINIDFNKIELPSLDSTANEEQHGVFLENPEATEILNEVQEELSEPAILTQSTTNLILQPTITTTTIETNDCQQSTETEDQPTTEKYPITYAVKEWMSNLREKTPDVDILKSPSSIYKEFCYNDDETDDTITQQSQSSQKNYGGNSPSVESPDSSTTGERVASFPNGPTKSEQEEEDEVTLFCADQSDLLDCWEDECNCINPTNNSCDSGKDQGAKMCSDAYGCAKCQNSNTIEEGEDVIEVYESKYGKNEAYQQILKEVEVDGSKQKTGYPNNTKPHPQTKLPYTRAICCSLQ